LLTKIISNPSTDKYRSILLSNPTMKDRVTFLTGTINVLTSAGFEHIEGAELLVLPMEHTNLPLLQHGVDVLNKYLTLLEPSSSSLSSLSSSSNGIIPSVSALSSSIASSSSSSSTVSSTPTSALSSLHLSHPPSVSKPSTTSTRRSIEDDPLYQPKRLKRAKKEPSTVPTRTPKLSRQQMAEKVAQRLDGKVPSPTTGTVKQGKVTDFQVSAKAR
jgi:hypothetical protein